MTGMAYELAGPADDAALRQLLRESPMPGAIRLTFEREPCYFAAAGLEGPLYQTMVARHTGSGLIAGMATRSARPRYVNGQVQTVGYLGHLRANPRHGFGLALARILARAFAFCRTLHADGRAPYYLLSVVAGNDPAIRVLHAGLRGMPDLRAYTRLHTYIITPRRRPPAPLPAGVRLSTAAAADIPALLDCLARNGTRHQFAPHWTAETLFQPATTPGLRPEDVALAWRGDRVVGCLALWDQSTVKQTVVQGYTGALGTWRGPVNAVAPVLGYPPLPPAGTAVRSAFASHLAVDDDDPVVFAALLRAVYNAAHTRRLDYFMLGLSEPHPLRPVVARAYRHLVYRSQLYLVAWEDGYAARDEVDRRAPSAEIAIL